MSGTPECDAYHNARHRCTDPKFDGYENYGGRGIKFLFTSFEQFFAELGSRPEGKTLDRINNDGNYEPGNVRWATNSAQKKNRRPSKKPQENPERVLAAARAALSGLRLGRQVLSGQTV